jgi:TonB family protein
MRSRRASSVLSAVFLLLLKALLKIGLLSACLVPVILAQDAAVQGAHAEQNHVIPPAGAQSSLIKKVNPVYPPLARQARIQGLVVLKIAINTSGDVQNLQLVSGHPMLAPAAIEAVKQWKYQPFLVDGEPANVTTTVQVSFTLAENNPPTQQGGVLPMPGLAAENPGPEAAVVRVSEGVMRSFRTEKVDPEYPPSARQQRIQGQVLLDVKIGASGEVENIKVISAHPLFAPPAIEAVKQWKYRPYLLNGNPVEVETKVSVSFTLSDDQALVIDSPLPPQRVRVSSGVVSGLLVSKVNPIYPPDAREQAVQGVVVLQVEIDKEGNVQNVTLISGHPLLAPAAIDAVKQWKYTPYLLNGNPVNIDTQVQVNFTLVRP